MRYIASGEREDSTTEMEEEEEEQNNNNWFSKWEQQLPSPDKLTPLSQTLITPDLALAFNIIPSPTTPTNNLLSSPLHHHHHHQHHRSTPPDFDSFSADPGGGSSSGGGGGGNGSGGEEPARTLKRPRLVWTPQLHKRFVDAVAHLGIKNAVPKTIMQLMSVDGLTRENVASHLQKYRLYLKRMQGINGAGGGRGGGGRPGGGSGDSATDRLFASSPVPPHFLHQGTNGVVRANSEHLFPYVPPVAMAAAAIHHHHQQQQASIHHHQASVHIHQQASVHIHHQTQAVERQTGHFVGSTQNGRRFEHSFSTKMGGGENLGSESNGRKVLTLFPTSDD